VVLLSDYAKGTLSQVGSLIDACRSHGVPVLVDPKGADFERYRGASIITPNLSEFEAIVGACFQDDDLISSRAKSLCATHDFDAVLVTRSERGMTLQPKEGEPLHLPALAREVFDVTGAGDTVIAAIAAGMASHESLENATRLANVAAGLVVGKVGTAAVTRSELSGALQDESLDDRSVSADEGVVTEVEVLAVVAQLKAAGKRIVLTNGCFDILHPGHVSYLSEAATLGDVLIVAVNNDASVSRLKGDDRPVNNLDARMSVLAGLRSVSYVVPFSEDTPARLIEAVTPDVLVKGGDYDVSQIAGHEHVIAEGGKVVILDFVEGHSTTATIARMSTNDEYR
jgi:D-beta-D-heptose 7-phosphate kinase/D-beta-D-heptose 1-phosphate adenosyltransferase